MKEITKANELEIVRLYDIEKYTLRRIGKIVGIDHHRVKRILKKYGAGISNKDRAITSRKGYKKKPFTEEHRKNIGLVGKGRIPANKGKKMPKVSLYKNMQTHLKRDVSLDFLLQFDDIDKLKCITSIINRDRVSKHFSDEQYKEFLFHFYNDETFNKTYNNWIIENKQQYAKPSLDHVVPLSKGGSWKIENLQIIPWCVNRAKFDFLPSEWNYIRKKYLSIGGDDNT